MVRELYPESPKVGKSNSIAIRQILTSRYTGAASRAPRGWLKTHVGPWRRSQQPRQPGPLGPVAAGTRPAAAGLEVLPSKPGRSEERTRDRGTENGAEGHGRL